MKRLNNKGLSIVEILLCFVLAALITASIYSIVDNFSSNKQIESDKKEIIVQKTTFTKSILDDTVGLGLQSINVNNSYPYPAKTVTQSPKDLYGCENAFNANEWNCATSYTDDSSNIFKAKSTNIIEVEFLFKNGETKELRILKQVSNESYISDSSKHFSDKFYIAYGKVNNTNQMTVESKIDFNSFGYYKKGTLKLYNTKIGNISIGLKEGIFKIDLRFDNPSLGQKYGINIVMPSSIDEADI